MIALLALLAVVTGSYTPPSYACDGSTATFAVTFPYLAQTDLQVTSTTAGGAVTTLVLSTDYVLNVTSTTTTATLTVNSPSTKCPSGSTLKINRNMACTQPQSFKAQTTFSPGTHEQAYDRAILCIQQVQAQLATTQNLSFASQNTFTATQTFAPASSDAVVATGGGTGRGVVASSGATSGVAGQFTSGNTVNAPIQVVGQTADPSTPANGEVWLNTAQQAGKIRVNGASNIFSGNPMMGANTAAGQSIANGAIVIIVFGTVERDTDSAYNAGTGRYTVPVGKGGDYVLTCTAAYVNAQAGATLIHLYKNAVQTKTEWFSSPAANQGLAITSIMNLAAADIVDCRTEHPSGSPQSLAAAANRVYFSLKRLSD